MGPYLNRPRIFSQLVKMEIQMSDKPPFMKCMVQLAVSDTAYPTGKRLVLASVYKGIAVHKNIESGGWGVSSVRIGLRMGSYATQACATAAAVAFAKLGIGEWTEDNSATLSPKQRAKFVALLRWGL
jgi:hypothetical protein